MPVPDSPPSLFPALTKHAILACQTSSWHPTFARIAMKTTVIRPLTAAFREYLLEDGVSIPEGSEDVPQASSLSDDDEEEIEEERDKNGNDGDSDDDLPPPKQHSFPELDAKIRQAIADYGAVFPKLNWTSPRDAVWILAPSSPLKCTSPSDVYLFLKSSDFVSHDLDPELVFACCEDIVEGEEDYDLELVLKKWYPVERSRELRCFVRQETLIGISQRDTNYYDFLNEVSTQASIRSAVVAFWETNIKGRWDGGGDYIFDILLTRDLSRAHIIDFNPYAPHTDPLLFTYPDLLALISTASTPAQESLPVLRVITSRAHPAAVRNAPANQHNMVPREALEMSAGRGVEEFREAWESEMRRASGVAGEEEK
ncbi:hypothetical protein BOTBODRAFT_151782 [Botryobasidium botryosum FD-172 SS1]|uniref:Uncharacterized protein n=1 Tax=Botryobasidium botryosum (strain FD-172 SS1) TaxID=930990 RepID=A0A067MYP9_BOTB1|nr:hypothetical protein BOTBODRAFT_151782 [Botryobasidium botryosum FD-172 SS1]